MLLSNVLNEYFPDAQVKFLNEREFDVLGLCGVYLGKRKLTFIDGVNYIDSISNDTSMVLVTPEVADALVMKNTNIDFGIAITSKPRILFFKIHNKLTLFDSNYKREEKDTIIGKDCKISISAKIAGKNVVIGNNVQIDDFAVINENTVIGDNCKIGSGVKIGFADFEYKRDENTIFGVEHCGGVIIGHDVDILANTVVNKAVYPWDNTVIGNYTKIDMLCNISHGAKIGDNVMIVALSGIGGRTIIGNNSWVGYGAIIRNGITIGDNARVNMGSVVSKDVESNESVTGNFAIEHNRFMELLKKNAGKIEND